MFSMVVAAAAIQCYIKGHVNLLFIFPLTTLLNFNPFYIPDS